MMDIVDQLNHEIGGDDSGLDELLSDAAEEIQKLRKELDDTIRMASEDADLLIMLNALAKAIGAEWDGDKWLLPFYHLDANGEVVHGDVPLPEWIQRRQDAARRLAQC